MGACWQLQTAQTPLLTLLGPEVKERVNRVNNPVYAMGVSIQDLQMARILSHIGPPMATTGLSFPLGVVV